MTRDVTSGVPSTGVFIEGTCACGKKFTDQLFFDIHVADCNKRIDVPAEMQSVRTDYLVKLMARADFGTRAAAAIVRFVCGDGQDPILELYDEAQGIMNDESKAANAKG